jgi:hypothetical protein
MIRVFWRMMMILTSIAMAYQKLPPQIYTTRKVIQKYHHFWNQDLEQDAWLAYSQPNSTITSIISTCNRCARQQTLRRTRIVPFHEDLYTVEEAPPRKRGVEWTPMAVMTAFQWSFPRYQAEKYKFLRAHRAANNNNKVDKNFYME